MSRKKTARTPHIRMGQELFRSWAQIAAVTGLSVDTARRTWRDRGLPIWYERGRPVTSRTLLVEYSRKRAKEAIIKLASRYGPSP